MKNVKHDSRLVILNYMHNMYNWVVDSVNDRTTYINFTCKGVV